MAPDLAVGRRHGHIASPHEGDVGQAVAKGEHSVFDIAHELELDYQKVRDYIERFREAGLVEAIPMPSPDDYDGVYA